MIKHKLYLCVLGHIDNLIAEVKDNEFPLEIINLQMDGLTW